MRKIITLALVIVALAAWTHGNPSGGGNFLTDGGANILTGSSGVDLLLAQ